MGLFEKKQELSGGGKKEKPGKMPPSKEQKPSGFGGRPFLRREEFRWWLRKEELRGVSKMPQKERVGLEKKLFDPKRFGQFIEPKEAERVYQEIKTSPKRSQEKYGFKSPAERVKALKILEKFLGK